MAYRLGKGVHFPVRHLKKPDFASSISETSSQQTAPSSGESTSRGILSSHGEKPAFRAGVRARQVQRGQQRRVSHDAWRDRREYLCRAQFQYRGVDEAVA